MRALSMAFRTLLREWRSGELGVLLLALSIAVSALAAVGFVVSRISAAVDLQANEVLAADLRLESPAPLGTDYLREARQRGLATATSIGTLSVVFHGDASQLTAIRAVGPSYPLRGTVTTAPVAFGSATPAVGIPQPGEVWAESRLLATLGAEVGDEVSIGAAMLRVGRALVTRPDQGSSFAELAPSLLMNAEDLAATQLIQPGSRARYADLFAGERGAVDDFKAWLGAHKQRGERLLDIAESSPQVKNAIDRAGRFLSLASLVSVLLCSIAVAMAARRYVQRHLDAVALMKTLGATRAFTLTVSLAQLGAIALVAAAIGAAFGYLAQAWLVYALRDLLAVASLPPPSLAPIVMAVFTALAMLAGFALPPLLQLSRVPAIRVLRRDIGPPPLAIWLAFWPAALAIAGLVFWVVRDALLAAAFIAGLALFLALLALCGVLLVRAVGSLRSRVGVAWRYGIANLARRRAESVVQVVAFGLGIMVLLLLALVRRDLLEDWRRSLPADVPNFFFINIPPDDRDAFLAYLREAGADVSRALPMIRGRMTAINDRPLDGLAFAKEDGEGFAQREQNLTWSSALGADNRIVAGRWWGPQDTGRALVSISTEYRDSIGLKLGDRLAFDVAGESFVAQVASVREVKWDSFQPNFFLVFPPGLLDATAGTWMTSAYFPPGVPRPVAQLVKRFPSVSVFDLGSILAQVRGVIDKAAVAVQSVFIFTLLAGFTVLLAAVQASRDERRFESAMLRTLGASRRTVRAGVLAEFVTLGLLAGVLAASGASVAGYFLARHVLDVRYSFDAWVWAWGIVAGAILVAGGGWLATRAVVRQSPLLTLRGG
ncbi:MAG: ABC transporter permease [Steroidobacteraceae bacterium]